MKMLDFLAGSQVLSHNPVIDSDEKDIYFKYLLRYVREGRWQKRKLVKAQLKAYADEFNISKSFKSIRCRKIHGCTHFFRYLPFDLFNITGYQSGVLQSISMHRVLGLYFDDWKINEEQKQYIWELVDWICGLSPSCKSISKWGVSKEYLQYFFGNLEFMRNSPYKILLTATMSAGKSTLLNSLVGYNISLSRNMACTSKVHSIVSKAYDDGYIYEYDGELVMNATCTELMEDNENNSSDYIAVGTYFRGALSGKRIIINDTPGVNYCGEEGEKHRRISRDLIQKNDYQLLIYLINFTQWETTDESKHLEYIRNIVEDKPVLFIINKIDEINEQDDGPVVSVLDRIEKYLNEKGFENPMLCPVSSRAGYLAKKSLTDNISEWEQDELDYFYFKFFKSLHIGEYYLEKYPSIQIPNSNRKEVQLLTNCGIQFIEKILCAYITGLEV